jgi:hypothetical protein
MSSDNEYGYDDRPVRGDKGMTDGPRQGLNETGRRLVEKVLFTMAYRPSVDFDAFDFTSLTDYVRVSQWWAAQRGVAGLPLEEDGALRIAYRIDLGDGGILMRASDDIARSLRESNPDAFEPGIFLAGGPIDLQAALRRMAEIEERSKTVAPRRSA